MPLTAGDKLGPYEITSLIGKGGMGEVYSAHDPRTGRDVAIKVSADRFNERFDREVRAVASLNHPNICTLFDVGTNYLVMELVEGEAPKGPLPLEAALRIARQIADALEAAHEKGITHRDLKPGNIKIKRDGTVKVLDFGLAKIEAAPAGLQSEDSPTLSMAATNAGVILGTAAYMSPEQARGKPVDKRADIWAFGVVLYELITGERLFQGEDVSHTMAHVITQEPKLDKIPAPVQRILKACLEKDPKKRLRDIGDVWRLMEESSTVLPSALVEAKSKRPWLWPAVAAVFVLIAAALAFVHFRETPPATPALRATILPPPGMVLDTIDGLGLPAVSPDGRRVVFGARDENGKSSLWVRPLDALTAQPLAGTEGATFPFWSPDSRFIAFFVSGKLKKIDANGGPAISLADVATARGGTWSRDGVILFAPGGGGNLNRVSASGGSVTPVAVDPRGRLPWFLPDGRHFLYQDGAAVNGANTPKILVGSLDGGMGKFLEEASSNAVYAQGHLLFLRDGTLMAQPFDTARLETSGEAIPLAEQVQSSLNTGSLAVISVSQTGLLTYRTDPSLSVSVVSVDLEGKTTATVQIGAYRSSGGLRLSPDGTRLATQERGGDGKVDIWIYELNRAARTRLTFDKAGDGDPVWSPDGKTIIYSSDRSGARRADIYRKSADGSGAEELLFADAAAKFSTSISPDGKFLLYENDTGDGQKTEIWLLPLTPEKPGSALKPLPILQSPANARRGRFSPDGRWIAFGSDESKRREVYVIPFTPGASVPAGKRQISTAGGSRPTWRPDGKAIFYLSEDKHVVMTEVLAKGQSLEVGASHTLFGPITPGARRLEALEVAPDGKHLFIFDSPKQISEPLTLIQNWTEGLKK